MLIVCPSCSTSYLIDPASVGPAGRTVRCARCKMTWFAGAAKPAPEVTAFVDSVIAEADAQSAGSHSGGSPSRPAAPPHNELAAAKNLSEAPSEPPPVLPHIETASPAVAPTAHNNDLLPHE